MKGRARQRSWIARVRKSKSDYLARRADSSEGQRPEAESKSLICGSRLVLSHASTPSLTLPESHSHPTNPSAPVPLSRKKSIPSPKCKNRIPAAGRPSPRKKRKRSGDFHAFQRHFMLFDHTADDFCPVNHRKDRLHALLWHNKRKTHTHIERPVKLIRIKPSLLRDPC